MPLEDLADVLVVLLTIFIVLIFIVLIFIVLIVVFFSIVVMRGAHAPDQSMGLTTAASPQVRWSRHRLGDSRQQKHADSGEAGAASLPGVSPRNAYCETGLDTDKGVHVWNQVTLARLARRSPPDRHGHFHRKRQAADAPVVHSGAMAIITLDPDAAALWHGELLAAARASRQLTATETAGRLGWTSRRLTRIETGEKAATHAEAATIADALGIPASAAQSAWRMTRGLLQPSPRSPTLVEYWHVTPEHLLTGMRIPVRIAIDPGHQPEQWARIVDDLRRAALRTVVRDLLADGAGLLTRPTGTQHDGTWTLRLPGEAIELPVRDVHRIHRDDLEAALHALTDAQRTQITAIARSMQAGTEPEQATVRQPAAAGSRAEDTTMLSREQVYERAGYSRSAGYRWIRDLLATDPTFPRPIGQRWRLDHLIAWEDHHSLAGLTNAQATQQTSAGEGPAETPTQPRRGRSRRAEA